MSQEYVLNIPTEGQSFESFEGRLSALDMLALPPARAVVSTIKEIRIGSPRLLDFSDLSGSSESNLSDVTRENMTKQLVHQHLAVIGLDFNPRKITFAHEGTQKDQSINQVDLSHISDIVDFIMKNINRNGSEALLLQDIQKEVDAILTGDMQSTPASVGPEANRLFAGFLPEDRELASRLSGDSMRIANKTGGVPGLRAAVDHLKSAMGKYPLGTVERATKLFITHHPFAREHLALMPLERRLSGPVSPIP